MIEIVRNWDDRSKIVRAPDDLPRDTPTRALASPLPWRPWFR
jgi:hypothetical protein